MIAYQSSLCPFINSPFSLFLCSSLFFRLPVSLSLRLWLQKDNKRVCYSIATPGHLEASRYSQDHQQCTFYALKIYSPRNYFVDWTLHWKKGAHSKTDSTSRINCCWTAKENWRCFAVDWVPWRTTKTKKRRSSRNLRTVSTSSDRYKRTMRSSLYAWH